MKVQGVSRDTLPWKSPFQPYTAWFGFIGSTIITLIAGFPVFLKGNWNASDFVSTYVGIPIFILPIIGWKVVHRTKVSIIMTLYGVSLPVLIYVAPVCAGKRHGPLVWSFR